MNPPSGKTVADSQLVTTTLMTPEFANFAGNVHGGHVLRLVDQIAYACAARYAEEYCVTRSVDRVDFKVPVRVGDLLTMRAQINLVGRTSMEVGVRVEAQDLQGGPIRHTNSCYLTMVAVRDGRSTPVPPLVCQTEDDRARRERAQLRRAQQHAVERIDASASRYREIIERAEVPILLVDSETGGIRGANQAACTWLAWTADQLETRTIWELHVPKQQGEARKFWEHVVDVGFGETEGMHHLCGDGRQRSARVTAWLIPLASGALIQRVLRANGE